MDWRRLIRRDLASYPCRGRLTSLILSYFASKVYFGDFGAWLGRTRFDLRRLGLCRRTQKIGPSHTREDLGGKRFAPWADLHLRSAGFASGGNAAGGDRASSSATGSGPCGEGGAPWWLCTTEMNASDIRMARRRERLRQLTSSEVGSWISASHAPTPISTHRYVDRHDLGSYSLLYIYRRPTLLACCV